MEKIPVIVVAGPTASGKTALAVELAKRLDGEIISADSMQIYKYMDIGTAKPTPEERAGIPHHLMDFLDPGAPFSVAEFVELAHQAAADIHNRVKLPILAGGTGLYIEAFINDVAFRKDDGDPELRGMLQYIADAQGAEALLELLRGVDPASAERLHPNNRRRIIRAIEFYLMTGTPISAHQEETKQKESRYAPLFLAVEWERAELYARIDKRVELMVEAGLFDEVRKLAGMGYRKAMLSMQGIGYRQVLNYLRGFATKAETVRIIQRDSRRYAKRQMTWFRREKRIYWLKAGEGLADRAMERITEAGF